MQYEEITLTDFSDICKLYEKYLNSGKYVCDEIYKTMETPEFFGIKAVDGGKLVGACYGTAGVLMTYPHVALEAEIRAAAGDRKIFTVDALVIHEDYRSHHISGELMNRLISRARALGYQATFSEMWEYPDGSIPVAPIFNELGSAIYEKLVDGFYDELEKYGLDCPLCGKHCTCRAKVRLTEL